MLKNRMRLRCATCAIARPDAELISPMMATTLVALDQPLGLGRRGLRIDAVFGDQLDLATRDAARRVDLLHREVDAHHRVFAERPEKAGARRQVTDAHRVGLAADDRGETQAAERRGGPGSLEQMATTTADRQIDP